MTLRALFYRKKQMKWSPIFLSVSALKQGDFWQHDANMFRQKDAMFEEMISKFISVVAPVLIKKFVLELKDVTNMTHLKEHEERLNHHAHALYAADIIIQQTNRSSRNMMEARPYFSAKNKLHGNESEASVLPNEMCIALYPHAKRETSKIDMFWKHTGCA